MDERSSFLEVRVLVTTVEPDMRRRIEEALEGKSVRLARIEAVSNISQPVGTTPVTYEDFKKMNPNELIKEIFRNNNGEDMSSEIELLLNEVMKEIGV